MTNEKSIFERQRMLLSRLVIWPLMAILLVTTSAWEVHAPIDGLLYMAGCVLAGIATAGRLWCSLYICGRKTKELVTCGPYSMTRNPLYFFSAIGAIGVGLATETFTVPALLILLFAVTYPALIRAEEHRLRGIHGDAYAAYAALTPRFFPSPSRYFEPDTHEVIPRAFRRELLDALWFVWLLGILEFGETLREANIIPTLLTAY